MADDTVFIKVLVDTAIWRLPNLHELLGLRRASHCQQNDGVK
jgi:hypothetical protein